MVEALRVALLSVPLELSRAAVVEVEALLQAPCPLRLAVRLLYLGFALEARDFR
jgi:hypothetical protein